VESLVIGEGGRTLGQSVTEGRDMKGISFRYDNVFTRVSEKEIESLIEEAGPLINQTRGADRPPVSEPRWIDVDECVN